MKRLFLLALLLLPSIAGGMGCAMCASPYDCEYAAYGGLRPRDDMSRGRVGSVFDPADHYADTYVPNPAMPKTAVPPAEEYYDEFEE